MRPSLLTRLQASACPIAAALVLVCLGISAPRLVAQTMPQPGQPKRMPGAAPELAPPPSLVAPGAELGPGPAGIWPIDLATALRLAGTNNLDIARAREVVVQAQVQLQRAYLMMLPNLGLGGSYSAHQGAIAKTEGNVIEANKDATFGGGGPFLAVGFAEAIFTPLVARQANRATQAGLRRVYNDTLLAVADAYFAVLRARRRLARVDLTLEFLTAEQPSPIRAGSKGLLPIVDALQKAGAAEALKAEVYRVQVEVIRRRDERRAALQDLGVAVAELDRLLRLSPTTALWPIEDYRVPLKWDAPWSNQPLPEQVRLALLNRPELAENQALVQAAVARVRTARYRPLLPNLVASYNYGNFDGGPYSGPRAGGSRNDLDVFLTWRLQNFGLGNRAEVREQAAVARQAELRQVQVQDRVVTQVVQVNELVASWGERVALIRAGLFDSSGRPTGPAFEAIRQNFTRIREQPGARPLEVLDSIRGLSDLLEAYGQSVTESERARFRLMIALGLPPEQIVNAVTAPLVRPPAAPK